MHETPNLPGDVGRGRRIVIVGAGLAGSLLALALVRMGFEVEVFERRPDPRREGFKGGRSINLALSCRGITALRAVGMADAVLAGVIPMRGRMMHDGHGELTFQSYSANPDEAINSVSRAGLNLVLVDAADQHDQHRVHFEHRCADVDLERPAIVLERPDGSRTEVEADLIIGTDGAFSAVRQAMQITDRFNYSQHYLEHGYKELTIPPAAECGVDPAKHDGFAMEPNALHIWPRRQSMMIALPNQDRTFTCTLFWPYEGERSFASIRDRADVTPFFKQHYPDAVPLMPTLVDDFQSNPTSSLVTIRCEPWRRNRKVLILGDAAHAIVPFFGQGMNAAFEDVRVLCEGIAERPNDLDGVVREFADVRKPHADAIADMALENFIEMRDKVADPAFLFRKRVDHALYRIDPDRFTPRYNLVSFSNMPYADAKRIGGEIIELSERLAAQLRAEGGDAWNDEELERRVRERVEAM